MINCVQFLVFTGISMFFYPGGTFADPNTSGYSIGGNLFSDLGRFTAHSGESNLISFLMYNISLFLMGALLIPFFLLLPNLFQKDEGKGFCIAGSILGVLVSISMAIAALTPADILYDIHVTFGFIKFVALLPMVIFYAFAILQRREFPNKYAIVYLVFGLMQFVFLIIMSLTQNVEEISAIFAAGQNTVIWAMTFCFFIEVYGARQVIRRRKGAT